MTECSGFDKSFVLTRSHVRVPLRLTGMIERVCRWFLGSTEINENALHEGHTFM